MKHQACQAERFFQIDVDINSDIIVVSDFVPLPADRVAKNVAHISDGWIDPPGGKTVALALPVPSDVPPPQPRRHVRSYLSCEFSPEGAQGGIAMQCLPLIVI